MKSQLSLEQLKSLLHYSKETGIFVWRECESVKRNFRGKEAGTINGRGYSQISVRGKLYLAHRLAWFYATGRWPENEIDHINQVKTDNRFSNLRDVTRSQNEWNQSIPRHNTSGFLGVHFIKSEGKWRARAWHDGRIKTIGRFRTAKEASDAYEMFCSKHREGFHNIRRGFENPNEI